MALPPHCSGSCTHLCGHFYLYPARVTGTLSSELVFSSTCFYAQAVGLRPSGSPRRFSVLCSVFSPTSSAAGFYRDVFSLVIRVQFSHDFCGVHRPKSSCGAWSRLWICAAVSLLRCANLLRCRSSSRALRRCVPASPRLRRGCFFGVPQLPGEFLTCVVTQRKFYFTVPLRCSGLSV